MNEEIINQIKKKYLSQGYIKSDDIIEISTEKGLDLSELEMLLNDISKLGMEIIDNDAEIKKSESNKFLRLNEMMDCGIVSPGDIIQAKDTDEIAVLCKDGDVFSLKGKMSMHEWLKLVYNWKGVATYQFAVHQEKGKTLFELANEKLRQRSPRKEEKIDDEDRAGSELDGLNLYLSTSNIKAIAKIDGGNIVLLRGSGLASEIAESAPKSVTKLRKKCKAIINNNILLEDIVFKSPSGAAKFVVGYPVNGRDIWKDENGTSLKELQENYCE